jgi:IMP and pyridine-specific 5'-nucleotidase
LFQCDAQCRLRYIPEEIYRPATGIRTWPEEQMTALLDVAEHNLRRCVTDMRLPARVVRKPRAVGVVAEPGISIRREQLDECTLSTQHALLKFQHSPAQHTAPLPFCAFNGGSGKYENAFMMGV